MSITINLYQSNSQANKVDKEITLIASHSCTIKRDTSVVAPVIVLEGSGFPAVNYAYIDEFNRYYYIDDIKSIRNDIWEMSLRCDVLMSFKNDIRNTLAIVNRQSNEYDMYLNDGTFKAFQNPSVQTIAFPNGFTGERGYVLMMNGAGQSSSD